MEALLPDLESDRTERKDSVNDSKKIHQAICAFANDLPDHRKPGVIFIGVNDNGSCANMAITDRLMLTLAQMREHILPFPTMKVQKHELGGCELADGATGSYFRAVRQDFKQLALKIAEKVGIQIAVG